MNAVTLHLRFARIARAPAVRSGRARAQPDVHVPLRRLQPEERRGGGPVAPPKPRPWRAGAARSSRWRSRRWGISPRCGTSPPRSAARPRFGRGNFPLDPGGLPASIVVKLAPFSEAVLQHFIFLERPKDSDEPDGEGFAPEFQFKRGVSRAAPHADADRLRDGRRVLRDARQRTCATFVARVGESEAFCGDRNLQISRKEIDFQGASR